MCIYVCVCIYIYSLIGWGSNTDRHVRNYSSFLARTLGECWDLLLRKWSPREN